MGNIKDKFQDAYEELDKTIDTFKVAMNCSISGGKECCVDALKEIKGLTQYIDKLTD